MTASGTNAKFGFERSADGGVISFLTFQIPHGRKYSNPSITPRSTSSVVRNSGGPILNFMKNDVYFIDSYG